MQLCHTLLIPIVRQSQAAVVYRRAKLKSIVAHSIFNGHFARKMYPTQYHGYNASVVIVANGHAVIAWCHTHKKSSLCNCMEGMEGQMLLVW